MLFSAKYNKRNKIIWFKLVIVIIFYFFLKGKDAQNSGAFFGGWSQSEKLKLPLKGKKSLIIFGQNFTKLVSVKQFTNDFVILLSISIEE